MLAPRALRYLELKLLKRMPCVPRLRMRKPFARLGIPVDSKNGSQRGSVRSSASVCHVPHFAIYAAVGSDREVPRPILQNRCLSYYPFLGSTNSPAQLHVTIPAGGSITPLGTRRRAPEPGNETRAASAVRRDSVRAISGCHRNFWYAQHVTPRIRRNTVKPRDIKRSTRPTPKCRTLTQNTRDPPHILDNTVKYMESTKVVSCI